MPDILVLSTCMYSFIIVKNSFNRYFLAFDTYKGMQWTYLSHLFWIQIIRLDPDLSKFEGITTIYEHWRSRTINSQLWGFAELTVYLSSLEKTDPRIMKVTKKLTN